MSRAILRALARRASTARLPSTFVVTFVDGIVQEVDAQYQVEIPNLVTHGAKIKHIVRKVPGHKRGPKSDRR